MPGRGWEALDGMSHGDGKQNPAYGPRNRASKGEAGIEKRSGRLNRGTTRDLRNLFVCEILIDEPLFSSIGEAAETNVP